MKKLPLFIIPIVLILCFTAGCAAAKPLPTTTGKPEISFSNISKDKIVNLLINKMINKGYQLISSNDYMLVFSQSLNSDCEKYTFGFEHNLTVNYNITETNSDVRIVASLITTVGGENNRNVFDSSKGGKYAEEIQKILDETKNSIK